MKIPHVINEVIFDLYKPDVETLYLENEVKRNLHVENYSWDDKFIPTLRELCLRVLIEIFERHQFLDTLTDSDVNYLFEHLPPTLPLEFTIPLIPDGIYWKRSYISRWKTLNRIVEGEINWKCLYLERHMEEFFENVEPEHYIDEDYHTLFTLLTPFIRRLQIRQLLTEKWRPADVKTEQTLINHINFNRILKYLTNVTELDLMFGPKNIGVQFEFNLFEFSVNDCRNLALGINCMPVIRIFRLHHSLLRDEHLQALMQAFVAQNRTLQEIDFSHCQITCRGANYIAELIRKHPVLEILKLSNNMIGPDGAKSLAYVLQSDNTCPLRHLDLRFNPLEPTGVTRLLSCLIRNDKRPAELLLASTGLTEIEAIALGNWILPLNKSLRYLDISNNFCGIEGGKAIARGIQKNDGLLYLDIRECGFDAESKFIIKKKLYYNDCLKRKRKFNVADVPEEDDNEIASTIIEETAEEDVEEEDEIADNTI